MSTILIFLCVFILLAIVLGLRVVFHKEPLSSSCGGISSQCVCHDPFSKIDKNKS